MFCEVEAILNSSPLSLASSDPNDLTPLTPNHFLMLIPPTPVSCNSHLSETYRKRWKMVQLLANNFWKRYQHEYLSELQVRQKWNNTKNNMQPGDVVLLLDESLPRCHWSLGRVSKVYKRLDHLMRSCDIVAVGKEYKRSFNKFVYLFTPD